MKKNVLFALTFIGLSCSYGQELNVKKVKEKVVVAKNIKKVYYVLKYNTDKRHGSYEEFLGKKKVVSGSYDLGLKDGDWLYTDGTGKYLQKGRFNKGLEVGEWEYRNFKGFYKRAFFSNKGRLDSAYSYDANKELVYKYVFDQEKNEGISETYLTDGFKEVTITKDSLKSVSIYYPNNQLFFEKKKAGSKLISTSNYYKKNGDLFRSSNFVDGTGMVLNFHLDKLVSTGQLVGSSSVTYKNGEPLGVYVSYDKKGTFLERGVLVKSIRVGKWMLWSSQKNQYVEKDYGPYNPKKKKSSKRMSLNNVSDVPFKAIQNPPLLMSNNDYSDNLQDAKKKFGEMVNKNLMYNLDTGSLERYCDSDDGVCRIYAIFTINAYGEVSNIKVRAKHKEIESEVAKVLTKLPTFVPAYQNGKNVNLIFQLPIVFRVKKRDPFADLNKS